ncbi:MAG TPA: hypothetical protein VFR97_03795 [Capillimicrobium sp.]|nr:hypothetical protein [Capillimicrobium sp.]
MEPPPVTVTNRRASAIALLVAGGLAVSAAAPPPAGAAEPRCRDAVGAQQLGQLRRALIADYPRRLRARDVRGPLLRLRPRVCRYRGARYALAAFVIVPEDPGAQRFTFIRRRSDARWQARVGTNSQRPLPCAIREVFHLDEC